MYTQCPKCATVFRITAGQLRVAEGEVRCGSCSISFNALASLSDDLPELTDAVLADDTESQVAVLDELGQANDEDQAAEHVDGTLEFDAPEKSWSRFFVSQDPEEIEASETDGRFPNDAEDFDQSAIANQDPGEESSPLELETSDPSEWNDFLSELTAEGTNDFRDEYASSRDELTDDDGQYQGDDSTAEQPAIVLESESTDAANAEEIEAMQDTGTDDLNEGYETPLVAVDDLPHIGPDYDVIDEPEFASEAAYEPTSESRASEYLDFRSDEYPTWIGSESEETDYRETTGKKFAWRPLATIVFLGIALLGQLLHYNRDDLATHPNYGEFIRNIYASLGSPLYPEWPLDAFEVRGTEAVAGRSTTAALDILATVEVVSREPVGLPLIRIALHDRWSNPVASRVFYPSEYIGTNSEIPETVSGGTIFPIKVSVIDPGTEAQNYVVDICLPNRSRGLLCQLGEDPFQS